MITIDSSALLAVLVNEPEASACLVALESMAPLKISAGTVAEVLIVADGNGYGPRMREFLVRLKFEIVPVTADLAFAAADAYAVWGKGRHPAKLNYGDCFSYALAKSLDCPLLFVGNDFSQTDIISALA